MTDAYQGGLAHCFSTTSSTSGMVRCPLVTRMAQAKSCRNWLPVSWSSKGTNRRSSSKQAAVYRINQDSSAMFVLQGDATTSLVSLSQKLMGQSLAPPSSGDVLYSRNRRRLSSWASRTARRDWPTVNVH